MIDPFGRTIDYLRVSVTDRCNLRCRYCLPEREVVWLPAAEILSFEEIVEVVRVAVARGVNKVRLTGGEPLVRQNIVELVRMLHGIEGLRDLAMTTNGVLLAENARALAAAGLGRVNISLDAIDPQRYAALTQGGDVRRVLAGLQAAREAGLRPIKLNCVVGPACDPHDADDLAAFAKAEGLEIRFIRQMNLAEGRFAPVEGGDGGVCPRCNRLRLSANGYVRPCLFSDLGFSVREHGPAAALSMALSAKPQRGRACTQSPFHAIGG